MSDAAELTLVERLQHFEKHQLEAGDEYGAEVLHRAAETLQACQREREALGGLLYAELGHRRNRQRQGNNQEREMARWANRQMEEIKALFGRVPHGGTNAERILREAAPEGGPG